MNPPLSRSTSTDSPAATPITVIPTSAFDPGNFSLELQGKDHGDPGVSLILVDAAPGRGPSLHRHDYAEVPAGRPHAFTNTGDSPLKEIDIHVADAFATDWR